MKTGENIRLRKDGRFEARYIRGRNTDGNIIYGYCYGKTYDEAKYKREEILNTVYAKREMNLLILGAGVYGAEVEEIAMNLRVFKKIAFLDDDESNMKAIGKINDMRHFSNEYPIAIPAIADNELRKKWMMQLENNGFIIPTLIHQTAVIASNTIIKHGSVICPETVVGPGATVEIGCFISSGAKIKRNSIVKEYTFVDYGEIV